MEKGVIIVIFNICNEFSLESFLLFVCYILVINIF